jgi:ABC-type multidrug transport system fused ATPase/permease subunit
MLHIAFGIIIAVILLILLPYILAFLGYALAWGVAIGIAVAIIFGSKYVLQEFSGEELEIGTYFVSVIFAIFLAFLIFKISSSVRNLGGPQNTVRLWRQSLLPAFTEQQRMKKARAIKATYEKAAEIKREIENEETKREEEQKAEEKRLKEELSDELETALERKLSVYLEDGTYRVRRDELRDINILIETAAGETVAQVKNDALRAGWTFSKALSVCGKDRYENVGQDMSIRSAAKAVLKLVRKHSAGN